MGLIQTPQFIDTKTFQRNIKEKGILRNKSMSLLVTTNYHEILNTMDKFFSLYITGSDGRVENTQYTSAIELILRYKPWCALDRVKKIQQELMNIFKGYNEDSTAQKIYGTDKPAVILAPSDNGTLPYFNNPERKMVFFPSRMIDAYPLYGDPIFWFREMLYKELQQIPQDDIDKRKSRVSSHRKLTETWTQTFNNGKKILTHFDLKTGNINYGKDQWLEIGIKMWPLRYVQYKLVEMICELVKNKKINQHEFQWIEPNMKDKMEFLRNHFHTNKDEESINLIINTYFECLQIHHHMQEQYKETPDNQIYTILPGNQAKEFHEKVQWMIKKLSETKLR